ncbi:MAG: helix-turn-helix domain-containing protein [Candidatus Methanomethylophilaceae archaeon]|jgi:predicted transcriptional regulator|nr:XRE family transcriptional regulator [Methanomassiliicoccales archaeon RumEn M2]MDD2532049.1 helix-turn-helix domain-containing protein [Candidatus Methanomethylophilaceae archaeon]MDI9378909.1 helix-turn-helix domain-containing protein [Candidatus Thermoplasmatota archaeon]MDD2779091.1 helix-turn-helix domain-containing protein [Candidatus Methanomethylophilaceae archaeon]MDD3127777.1 helix-turn-helix domain-containing protein [Candidatus Methanomethylophilaceae archaeon]
MSVSDLINGMLKQEGGFQKALKTVLDEELKMTINEFSRLSGISQSTMYKILEDKREPNLRTVRNIIKAVKALSDPASEDFIAIIASHQVTKTLPKSINSDGREIFLREYPVSTVEDAIVAAVKAERDGALAVVCAPIVTPTVERILSIPVSPVIPQTSLMRAVERVKGFI